MNATAMPATERLLGYLATCGGSDRFEFHDGFGEPDPLAARAFAERLRDQLADHPGVAVRQTAHHVVVSLAG